MPYTLINKLTNNSFLQPEDLTNISIRIINKTLIGATDGSKKDNKMAGGGPYMTLNDKNLSPDQHQYQETPLHQTLHVQNGAYKLAYSTLFF